MLDGQATGASHPGFGQLGAFAQAVVLIALLAGAGLLALFAFAGEPPPLAPGPPEATHSPPPVVVPALAPARLIVIVESDERAQRLREWRQSPDVHDSARFEHVEFVGPLSEAALQETITYTAVACRFEGCPPAAFLDLRGAPWTYRAKPSR